MLLKVRRVLRSARTAVLRVTRSRWSRRGLNSTYAVGILAVTAFAALYLLRTPPPGKAVAWLGLAAIVMALRGDRLKNLEKTLWILVIFVLLRVELSAIDEERQNQESEHTLQESKERLLRKQENDRFSAIMQEFQTTLKLSQEQFQATMHRTNSVLTNITGGKSYAVVMPILYPPRDDVPLLIENHGTDILTGVSVTIYSDGLWMKWNQESILKSVENRIVVGTLHPGERLVLSSRLLPGNIPEMETESGSSRRCFVWIAAQNFTSEEILDLKKYADGKWTFRYSVFEHLTNAEMDRLKTIHQSTKYPKLEQIEWTDDNNKIARIN